MTIPRILSIAGSDSGGGAGIQADIKTITMLGGHAMTAITTITAQNTLGVAQVMPVPTDLVLAQIDAVVGDIGVDAVKIGMIGGAMTAEGVAEALAGLSCAIVFDPVMIATSGSELADAATVAAFTRLMRAATLVTPNAPELAALTGLKVETEAEMEIAAKALADHHCVAVLAKGGHLPGDLLADLLIVPGEPALRWASRRIETRHSHGTGCTLSSAIAAGLGAGLPLESSIDRARAYVRAVLDAAPGIGLGHGPLGHALGRAHFSGALAGPALTMNDG